MQPQPRVAQILLLHDSCYHSLQCKREGAAGAREQPAQVEQPAQRSSQRKGAAGAKELPASREIRAEWAITSEQNVISLTGYRQLRNRPLRVDHLDLRHYVATAHDCRTWPTGINSSCGARSPCICWWSAVLHMKRRSTSNQSVVRGHVQCKEVSLWMIVICSRLLGRRQ